MARKILLIEDNLEVRENTAEILELADYEVITAENGKIGVKLAKEEKPELIICDIMMPELDGYGVLHILSKNHNTANIPFIFLTAKADKSDFRKGMTLGADDYLTKPFEEVELMDAIESRLKKSDSVKANFESNEDGLQSFLNKAQEIAQLDSIKNSRSTKTFKKKEAIFREGDFANSAFLIQSGKVKTCKINEDGKEFITGLHESGNFIGYLAILQNSNHLESAIALEETTVATIDRQELLDLIYGNREVAHKFIEILSQNLASKEQELVELAYNTVRKRVADALLRLQATYDKNEKENFTIAISRADLAAMVGTAQESVIRFLSEFKEDGYIEVSGSNITITNTEGLESMKY